MEQPTETGSVSATELANSLARHLDALRSTCCSPSAKCSGLQGRIALQLRLSPDGNVERASIGETSVYDRQLRACIRERVSTWRLATHESPQSVDVVVPLRLRFPPDDAGP